MYTNFGGCGFFGFGVKFWQNFSFGPWTMVHGDQKYNLLKNFMQVEVDVMT